MERLSTLAFRNLRVRIVRTLLTIAGIVLGVAVIFAISITNRSTYKSFEALFTDLAGSAHLTVNTSSKDEEGFNQRVLERVQGVEGVLLAVPSTSNATMLMLEEKEVALTVYGVDPAIDREVRPYRMAEGDFLPEGDKQAVIVARDFAERHDIEVGKEVTLLGAEGPEDFLVVGIMADEGPARRAKMVMPLLVSQEVFARGKNIDAIDVVAEEGIAASTEALDRLKATLQEELGPAYEVVYPAARAKGVAEALRGMSMGLSYFAVASLFTGAYLVFNTFSMTVAERTREIGMLRAIGTTRWQNFRLILTEAVILGLFGSLFGFLIGLLISIPMMKIMGTTFGIEKGLLSIPPGGAITGFIVGMMVTISSALIPAMRASRVSPVEAIAARGRERKAGWFIRHGWKAGLALLVISELIPRIPMRELPEEAAMGIDQMSFLLFIVGLTLLVPLLTVLLERLTRPLMSLIYGNEGRIGSGNVHRVKGRTSLTVGALTVGVLMFIIFGVIGASMTHEVSAWMDAALRGDLFVSSFRPMRVEFGQELASVEGVSTVTPMYFIMPVKMVGVARGEGDREEDVAFIAVEPSGYTQISEFKFASGQGDEKEMLERFTEGDAVFVATQISEMLGLKKGDLVRLRTRRGERDFFVAGVIVDYTWGGWSIHGSWEDLKRYFATNKAHLFMVDVAPEASVEDVQRRIEEQYGKTRHVEVESGREYREKWMREFMQFGALFDVVVVIGVLIAAFGVTNTLVMNVLERIREIGSLRAVGMTRPQVMRMILAEALIIGILGGILGMVFGAYSSYYAIQGMAEGSGWELTFILPTSLLLIGMAIALGVSQVAALYPAWRAARINIVRAVQYE